MKNKSMSFSLWIVGLWISLTTGWCVLATAFTPQPSPSRKSHSSLSATSPSLSMGSSSSINDSWALLVLGDLHLEDDMTFHNQARQDCIDALHDLSILVPSASSEEMVTLKERVEELREVPAKDLRVDDLEVLLTYQKASDAVDEGQEALCRSYMVSLGDLGRKDIRHEPGDAGTTKSFEDAKSFMDGFGLPYNLVTGNHDLEGLDEFDTDEDNLNAFLACFNQETPNFSRVIGEKTLLLGLSTVRFRDATYSSHEVYIDQEQIDWFDDMVKSHPAADGWKILVFSHAPILGSGLRVLQSVHITNGCAWLNHSSEEECKRFVEIVKANPQIKCWASGHFHLSQDFEDSITRVSSCTFLQVGVVGPVSTRDGKRQTRLLQGTPDQIKIFSINHHIRDEATGKAEVRLDATIDLAQNSMERVPLANGEENTAQAGRKENWFQAYVPREEDGCYLESPEGSISSKGESTVCWWHMADGRVLGLHGGQLVEYHATTLSPLGVVVTEKHLGGREVVVVQDGTALVLVDDAKQAIEVIHPNEDGSYWRKFQRNKRVRQEEKAREEIAKRWLETVHSK